MNPSLKKTDLLEKIVLESFVYHKDKDRTDIRCTFEAPKRLSTFEFLVDGYLSESDIIKKLNNEYKMWIGYNRMF